LPVGTYRLAITGSKIFLHNVDRMPRFAVEFVVLESSNPEVRVGDASYSWVESYHDQYGYGPNAIKGYVCSILRKKDPSIGDPAVNWQDSYTDRVVAGLDVGVEMTAMVVPRVSQGRGKTPAGTVLGRFYWAD
jgi:hypothetical protein